MNLSERVDIDILKRKMAQAHILLIMLDNEYIEAMKNPEDGDYLGLNVQIQQAAKGEQDVYLLIRRPIEKDNFSLVMDMLAGSKLKTIVFFDKDDKEDMEMATRIIRFAMASAEERVRVIGTSGDAVKK
uniref:Uncharacterized protein n=1 Tax=viral metagenome TaxID=1070528 RepID=A0A6M3LUA7_9ZZZZ